MRRMWLGNSICYARQFWKIRCL
ncbi:protein of unknown function [Cupriavidus taiwanensis]|nr:protein of unknown function [Cupriavidus taiwanensis]